MRHFVDGFGKVKQNHQVMDCLNELSYIIVSLIIIIVAYRAVAESATVHRV